MANGLYIRLKDNWGELDLYQVKKGEVNLYEGIYERCEQFIKRYNEKILLDRLENKIKTYE